MTTSPTERPDTVAFIGGGNMTRAIVLGMLKNGYPANSIRISEPDSERRDALANQLEGVAVCSDNADAIAGAETVVLAVKPQVLPGVCRDIAAAVQAERPLVVSIAAGTRGANIERWLGGSLAVVRAMPNQPALLGRGVAGIVGNARAGDAELARAQAILGTTGAVVRVRSEADIDAVTAVSGSGPAYFFLLIDILATAGTELGLDPATAKTLAIETAIGAAAVAKEEGGSMGDLIERVRSPGGTTAAALDSLDADGVRDIFKRAVTAARDRATELAES
jgi:pyrroline-5-carboxylate reductase